MTRSEKRHKETQVACRKRDIQPSYPGLRLALAPEAGRDPLRTLATLAPGFHVDFRRVGSGVGA